MNLKEFIELEKTKQSVLLKLNYLKQAGLDEYLCFACSVLGLKRVPQKGNNEIIEQIIPSSPNDINKKVKNKEHYKAHLSCIEFVLNKYFLNDGFLKNFEAYIPELNDDLVIYNYYNLLREILFDMSLIIQDFNWAVKKLPPDKFKVAKNLYQHDFTLHKLLPQFIYGQGSFHSYIDREPFVSISIIRQIIELKIRNAFGIMGSYDTSTDSYEPLALSLIFDELKRHQNEIDFAIPLANIIRINGWSNMYLHTGMKDYLWTIIFVHDYLHEFIAGREQNGGWSINSGIRIKKQTLERIRQNVENNLKVQKPNSKLFKTAPDIFILE